MTVEEARRLMGRAVLYSSGLDEPEKVIITSVASFTVFVSWCDRDQHKAVTPGQLMPFPEDAEGDLAAACQASLNEVAAALFRAAPGDPRQSKAALDALRELNWAARFEFEGTPPSPSGASREYHLGRAVQHLHSLKVWRAWDRRRAEMQAQRLERTMPEEAAAALRRSKASAPALVYVIMHPRLGATKIGVSDPAGARIAEHRRAGWLLLAAFGVAASAAMAIEAEILRWWRADLALPSFLAREQMPQGGWTETVASGSIDLAATVTHVCELSLLPEAKPAL
jgi:hypothetical protein